MMPPYSFLLKFFAAYYAFTCRKGICSSPSGYARLAIDPINSGKNDGRLSGSINKSYLNAVDSFVQIINIEKQIELNNKFRSAQAEVECTKIIVEENQKNYEETKQIERILNQDIDADPSKFSGLLGTMYTIAGFLLIIADIPFSLQVVSRGFEMRDRVGNKRISDIISDPNILKFLWEAFAVAVGIASIAFFFKYFFDHVVIDKWSKDKGKAYYRTLYLILVITIIAILLLGLFRAAAFDESTGVNKIILSLAFIIITITFPMIGAVCLSAGIIRLRNSVRKNLIQLRLTFAENKLEKSRKEHFSNLARVQAIKEEKSFFNDKYIQFTKFFASLYEHNVIIGYFTPEALGDSSKLFDHIRNWLRRFVAFKVRQLDIDQMDQKNLTNIKE